jgi:hypothetical protein
MVHVSPASLPLEIGRVILKDLSRPSRYGTVGERGFENGLPVSRRGVTQRTVIFVDFMNDHGVDPIPKGPR